MAEPGQIQTRPYFPYQILCHTAAFARSIQADSSHLCAQGFGNPEGFFALVLKRIHQDCPGHIGRHVCIVSYCGLYRVAQNQHQGVGHGACRFEPQQLGAKYASGPVGSPYHRRPFHHRGDCRMDVPCPETYNRKPVSRLFALGSSGCPG